MQTGDKSSRLLREILSLFGHDIRQLNYNDDEVYSLIVVGVVGLKARNNDLLKKLLVSQKALGKLSQTEAFKQISKELYRK